MIKFLEFEVNSWAKSTRWGYFDGKANLMNWTGWQHMYIQATWLGNLEDKKRFSCNIFLNNFHSKTSTEKRQQSKPYKNKQETQEAKKEWRQTQPLRAIRKIPALTLSLCISPSINWCKWICKRRRMKGYAGFSIVIAGQERWIRRRSINAAVPLKSLPLFECLWQGHIEVNAK